MRLRKTVERRQDFLKSKNADVSPEAQELYRAIAKQLGVSSKTKINMKDQSLINVLFHFSTMKCPGKDRIYKS